MPDYLSIKDALRRLECSLLAAASCSQFCMFLCDIYYKLLLQL